jgi:hypothetical protein
MLAAVLVVIAACVIGNLWIDPYVVLHPLAGRYFVEPSTRISKLAFLAKNCGHFDSYFVGDSRSALLNGSEFAAALSGRRFYNFSAPADGVDAIVRRIDFLVARGCPIKTVILNESLDVILGEKGRDAITATLGENPLLSGESRLPFYTRYFLSPQPLVQYATARYRWPEGREIFYPDGHVDYLFRMRDEHGFEAANCGMAKVAQEDRKLIFNKLAAYRALVDLAARRHFQLIVWIAPLNRERQWILQEPEVREFQKQLQNIPGLTAVYPSSNSSKLGDFHYWHDCGHFDREVFDELIAPGIAALLRSS